MHLTRKEFLHLAALAGASLLTPPWQRNLLAHSPIAGPLYLRPGDKQFPAFSARFNKRIIQQPAVIALCRSPEHVAEAIAYAQEKKLPIAIKSGGHSFEGYSSNDNGLVIDLALMTDATLNPDTSISAGPGCTLGNLYDTLLPAGRLIPAGSCATVGLGGLALGGGYGFFSRKYGLTCDSLINATFVTANGKILEAKNNPDLLWALRGGGTAGLGVVTNLIFNSHPAPKTFTSHRFKAYKLTTEKAAALLEQWFDLTPTLPDSCFSAFVLNGKTLTLLITNFEAPTDALEKILLALQKTTDSFTRGKPAPTATALKRYYGIAHPVYFKNASAGLYNNYAEIRAAIPPAFDLITTTPGMIYQINTLGGNIANPQFAEASCYPHRTLPYLSELQTYWDTPAQAPALIKTFAKVQQLFATQGIKPQYANYCSADLPDWQHAYYGPNYTKLQQIKRTHDPTDIFHHPQSIRI